MKKSFKRILSALLVLSIMLSLFAVHASAATVSESESNNDYASANKITLGNTIKGVLNSAKDNDYYKITSSTDGKVSLIFKHPYAESSHGWMIYYYEYKGGKYTQFTSYTVRMSGGDTISLPSIGVAASATYYVRINGIYNYDNTVVGKEYQLVTSFTSTSYEKEVNDGYANATPISLGNTYGGNLNNADDNDCYKITSSTDGKVSLSFKHKYENSSHGWMIYYYEYKDGKYTQFTSYTVRMNVGDNIALPSIGVAASAIYYVRINGIYNYDNTVVGKEYELVTSFTSTNFYEKEVNDDYNTATPVTLGNTYGGNLNNANDNDYYKFTSSTNRKLNLDFKHTYEDSSHGWTISYYEYKDGKYTGFNSYTVRMNGGDTISLPSIDMVASVTYYIRVDGIYNYDDTAVSKEYAISFGVSAAQQPGDPIINNPGSGFFANLANLINEWANSDNILLRILGIILKVILPFVG